MEINSFNMLVSIVEMLATQKDKNSPYIVVAMSENKEAAVTISGDARSVLHMFTSITESILKVLSKDISELDAVELISSLTAFAIINAFNKNEDLAADDLDEHCTYVDDNGNVRSSISIKEKTSIVSTTDEPLVEDFMTLENGAEYRLLLSFKNKKTGTSFVVISDDEVSSDGTIKNLVAKVVPEFLPNLLLPVTEKEKHFVMKKYHQWLSETEEDEIA